MFLSKSKNELYNYWYKTQTVYKQDLRLSSWNVKKVFVACDVIFSSMSRSVFNFCNNSSTIKNSSVKKLRLKIYNWWFLQVYSIKISVY